MEHRSIRPPAVNPTPPLVLILGFWVCDLFFRAIAGSHDTPYWIGLPCIGAVIAQLGLVAAWGVFAPQRLPLRLMISVLLALSLALALVAGMWASTDLSSSFDSEAFFMLLALPLWLLAVQAPLWVLKFARGARISSGDTSSSGARQFGLQELLTLTALVAVALGLAQVVVQSDSYGGRGPADWSPIVWACGYLALWSGLVVLPCIWGVLLTRNPLTGTAIVGGYQIVLVLVAATVVIATSRMASIVGFWEISWGLFLFQIGSVGTILVSLGIVRGSGYRWHRDGDPPVAAPPVVFPSQQWTALNDVAKPAGEIDDKPAENEAGPFDQE